MASSKAATVEEYLQELPEDRREVVSTVRDVILRNLPDGYTETMAWGMITYGIPLERYPTTYNGQPLGYVALAAQKNSYSLYLLGAYMDPAQEEALLEAFRREGKKLDMGKSCVRFKKTADLPLDDIGQLIAATTPEQFIARYEASRAR
ncbi:DUF1801 domain-containing protein [Longimicrobium sp.]|jgi:hypothetical protein|uniref:DUF1801 domain-containing protein n=1 Tax=Longimicrobium sp. TaxID=2029185 RepID=UPI002ED93897